MKYTWSAEISCTCTSIGCRLETIRLSIQLFSCLVLKDCPCRTFDYGNAIRFDSDCFQYDTLQASELRIDPQIAFHFDVCAFSLF